MFPLKRLSLNIIRKRIKPARKSPRSKGGYFLGYPHTTPLPIALKAYQNYLRYNSNHVGTITRFDNPLTSSRQLEREVIQMFGGLYGDPTVDGYINSGGTEGNILGVWIGKNYLNQRTTTNIALLSSELAHHSIEKAASLNAIDNHVKIPVNSEYRIDTNKLEMKMMDLLNRGVNGFILVLTSGYTCTGTYDLLDKVEAAIRNLKDNFNFQIYIHVDAAIGGLVFPFLGPHGRYFACEYVQSVSVDPHKMGYVPIGAGIFLCRKGLQALIETSINYVEDKKDDTLIGSRNGANAVTIWAVLNYLGIDGFRKTLEKLIALKTGLIKSLENEANILILNSEMNMLCLSFPTLPDRRLPEFIEEKYTLDQFKLSYHGQEINCYKIYIMPHVTAKVLKNFVQDLKKVERGD